MKKIILLTMVLVLSLSVSFADSGFSDVSSTHWAKPYIDTLKETSIIAGYPDGTFMPKANVKINEFITMTVKALGYRFEPMSSDWSKPYIEKAIELKIIEDREFNDYNAQIRREQMTSIVVNAVSLSDYRPSNTIDQYVKSELKDYHLVSDYYKQNVLDSYKFGIIEGFEDHTFKPQNYSTRAEASVVISKIINKDQRVPFTKTDEYYVLMPFAVTDETAEHGFRLEQVPVYAPIYNGKPFTEILDIAKIFNSLNDIGVGQFEYGGDPVTSYLGGFWFKNKEYVNSVYEIDNILEQSFAYVDGIEGSMDVNTLDITSDQLYDIFAESLDSTYEQNYDESNHFLNTYGIQYKKVFDYLFESDSDRVWQLFLDGLNYRGEWKKQTFVSNGRNVYLAYSREGSHLYASMKR